MTIIHWSYLLNVWYLVVKVFYIGSVHTSTFEHAPVFFKEVGQAYWQQCREYVRDEYLCLLNEFKPTHNRFRIIPSLEWGALINSFISCSKESWSTSEIRRSIFFMFMPEAGHNNRWYKCLSQQLHLSELDNNELSTRQSKTAKLR